MATTHRRPAEAPVTTVAELDAAAADPRPPLADVVAAMDAGAALPISLHVIDDNPFQPRLVYDDERIGAIAASIRQHGLLQAPLGRRMPDGRVQLAFGHSRLRAFRKLAAVIPSDMERWGRMPVLLRDLDDETMALHAWIENRDRKDLTAYEEAKAIERYTGAFGWTQKQAAEKLQLTQPTIANKLRLLRLPDVALRQLEAGQISERQAAALLPLMELPETARATLLNRWVGNGTYIKDANELIATAATYDSATIRKLVDDFVAQLTIPLAKQPWRNETFDIAGVVAPSCAECPIRLKSGDRCPDKACAERKASAQKAEKAVAAAAAAGLPTKSVSGYGTYDDLSGVNLTAIRAKAQEKKCDNLGVIWLDGGYAPHKVEGFPSCAIACCHGKGKRCGCKQSLARSADPASSTEAKNRHERARIKQELIEPAEEAARQALAQPTAAVWRRLLRAVNSRAAGKLDKNADVPAIQAAIAAALIDDQVRYNLEYSPSYSSAKATLTTLLNELGRPAPWAARAAKPEDAHSRANDQPAAPPADPLVEPLDAIRTALAAVRAWMAEEVEDTPDDEIHGTLAELATTRARLEQLQATGQVSATEYAALTVQIRELETDVNDLWPDPVATEVGV